MHKCFHVLSLFLYTWSRGLVVIMYYLSTWEIKEIFISEQRNYPLFKLKTNKRYYLLGSY